ncbi:MAG: NAD(P)-dependent glycerol-3-phosphate dehydrogenase [Phycisphaerae bacterium]|nr:NAD(P)-dependent glycerol-3-phosphate dehydrogenase [Phycisphaerae bacterium]
MRISVIGDGAMATVCSVLLQKAGHRVTLWSAFPDYARQLDQERENVKYLPGFSIPPEVTITADAERAFRSPQVVVNAVPCQYMRRVWEKLAASADQSALYVSVTKGIENETLLRPTQILQELLGTVRMAVLSGPSIAREVARGLPASLVAASDDLADAQIVQKLFSSERLRIYTNRDVVGVELAGAMKNVIALAAGVIDGINAGDNAKAALLTRGLVEITRLGVALGAGQQTFSGLAGLGDLVTTCISPHGRNRTLGELIGKGMTLEQACGTMNSVVEGVATTRSMVALARQHRVEMPITEAVHRVIFEGQSPGQAITELMVREPKGEFQNLSA